jgi:hypothetical protein
LSFYCLIIFGWEKPNPKMFWGGLNPTHGTSLDLFLCKGMVDKGHELWLHILIFTRKHSCYCSLGFSLNITELFLLGNVTSHSRWPTLKVMPWGHEAIDFPGIMNSVLKWSQHIRGHIVLALMEFYSLNWSCRNQGIVTVKFMPTSKAFLFYFA